jgi:thiosulfate dehydrogenase [quinone] large subunit
VLLWAGLDKVFGWGLSTPSGEALVDGVSPTRGFLQFGLAEGSPAAAVLQPLAGNPVVDVLYLLGTVGAGLALLLGVGVRLAGIGGAVLFGLLWFSSLPLEHNPFLDEHLLWALACLVVVAGDAGRHLGLGTWWQSTTLVTRARWLA